jgi:hypothetical protein
MATRDPPYADRARSSAKLLKNGALKTYKRIPQGIPTTVGGYD